MKVSIDIYTGQKFSSDKMISLLKNLDVNNININANVLFFEFIADHFPDQAPYCIERIIYKYRKIGKPRHGISRVYYYLNKYGIDICTSEILIVLGDVLKDIGNIDVGNKCIAFAKMIDSGKLNDQLLKDIMHSLENYNA